ncbi:tRNA modification GTPase [Flagellimonas sp.]|uniref:tRNA modification GTPase n=1 Tax=Flagellimonas sp. TaxID=2058762 RepID=UPI003F4A301E
MKKLLFVCIVFFCLKSNAQISFEKGYFINNNNQKVDCFIRNIDWRNNPTEFEYKLDLNSESKIANIKSIKEFSIDNTSKYERHLVDIDRSSEQISKLSYDQNPKFSNEELFLKVLGEGKANLYEYVDGNLTKYFYNTDDSEVEQLIFKSYRTTDNRIGKNNRFRQQLLQNLACSTIKTNDVLNLDYTKRSLTNFFIKYNSCEGANFFSYQENGKRDFFNLSLRPRLNLSSLSFEDSSGQLTNFDFDDQSSFSFGIEAEFILPFNKGKWALLVEPTYQSFKSQGTTELELNVLVETIQSEIDYTSIELPIGVRHYFFLNNSSKIFINASLLFDFTSSSSIEFIREDNSTFQSIDVTTSNNIALGLGYKLKDRYSLEIRYFTSRDVIGEQLQRQANLNTLSIILGYSVF